MTLAPPIRFRPDLETVDADEGETIGKLNDTFDTILERTREDYGFAVRAVHAKAHGILKGRMTVEPGLPPELAQGLFATPGGYDVVIRLSTNAGDILPDTISLPRGLAMKVMGVDGERMPDAEGRTQDFIMVNGPVFQAKTAQDFQGKLKLLATTTDRVEGTKEIVSSVLRGVNSVLSAVGIESAAVQTIGGAPSSDPLGDTYFSVTPFRYGDYVAKFSLVPVSPGLIALTDTTIEADAAHPDKIRDTVRSEMRTTDAIWELRVQLLRDESRQSIEDSTTEWTEDVSPFQTVATIHAAPQDSWSAETVAEVDEGLRFSVWTGLAAHRPLGNINRARNAPYRHSADFRARANGCPMHEPA